MVGNQRKGRLGEVTAFYMMMVVGIAAIGRPTKCKVRTLRCLVNWLKQRRHLNGPCLEQQNYQIFRKDGGRKVEPDMTCRGVLINQIQRPSPILPKKRSFESFGGKQGWYNKGSLININKETDVFYGFWEYASAENCLTLASHMPRTQNR